MGIETIINDNNGEYILINGILTGQTPKFLPIFDKIIDQFDTIIEIGTGRGGLTSYIFNKKKIGSKLMSFDIKDRKNIKTIVNEECFIIGDCFNQQNKKSIIETITSNGKVLLLCDGGNKEKEFNTFKDHLKINDVIMLHDFSADGEEYKKYQSDNNWVTNSESHLRNINTNGLKKFMFDEFKSVFWGCFKKL